MIPMCARTHAPQFGRGLSRIFFVEDRLLVWRRPTLESCTRWRFRFGVVFC